MNAGFYNERRWWQRPIAFPKLKGWWTVPEVGRLLGVTSKRAYQMVREGKFDTVRVIGDKGRQQYLVGHASLRRYAASRHIELTEIELEPEPQPEISAEMFDLTRLLKPDQRVDT